MTGRTLIRAEQVIDGSGQVIKHGAILISDALIEAVGPSSQIGQRSDVDIIDLGAATVLPGLIDVHNHVTFPGDARVVQQVMACDTDAMLGQGRVNAANLLAAGVTTVRDLGGLGDTVFRLVADIDSGRVPGPQILPSTAQLTTVGGPNAPLGGGCADLAAACDRIDSDADQGARVVKIIATGSMTDTNSDPTRPVFDDETVLGIVEHAHRRGMAVAAHAHGTAGVVQAARCGVDTIEHASFLSRIDTIDTGADAYPSTPRTGLSSWPDEDALAALAHHQPWIVPTLATAVAHNQAGRATPTSTRGLAHRLQIGRLLHQRGLRLVTGTDGGGVGCPHLSLIVEIEQFHQLGMTTMEAILAATAHAAACLALTDRGTLTPGSRADLIAVPANPLDHLDTLRAPDLVISGGRIAHRIRQEHAPIH